MNCSTLQKVKKKNLSAVSLHFFCHLFGFGGKGRVSVRLEWGCGYQLLRHSAPKWHFGCMAITLWSYYGLVGSKQTDGGVMRR